MENIMNKKYSEFQGNLEDKQKLHIIYYGVDLSDKFTNCIKNMKTSN